MVQTSVEVMHSTALKVEDLRGDIDGLLKLLKGDVQAVAGSWHGTASTSFMGVMSNWDTSANKLSVALQGINEAIRASGTGYDTSEQQNTSAINNVAGTMNW